MQSINQIAESVRRGERLSSTDAIRLWREAPLWLLGELAVERKRQASGDEAYYCRTMRLEPSNICLYNCEFCSFVRREGDAAARVMTLDEIEAHVREMQHCNICEVRIEGGVHPKHDLEGYCAMIRRVRGVLPHVAIKAYSAVEIYYVIRRAGISIVEGLRRLKEAGLEAITGGGAELFDEALRAKICPDKCTAEEWLAVHRAAHNMDIATDCTMLYGHIESVEQRVDHLERLRRLQDEAPGFKAFFPLKYRGHNNRMTDISECSVEEDMRTIAMSRIMLDNIPHIGVCWEAFGKPITEMALAFGADNIDGRIEDSTTCVDDSASMSVEELEDMVRGAGFAPVECDTHYRAVERESRVEGVCLLRSPQKSP